MSSHLTLFYHPLSSYCHKVLVALYEHGVAFDRRIINLGDAQERAELQGLWPPTKFPVLGDSANGRHIAESSIIIEYLERHGGASRLLPADADDALDARLWDRIFDQYVQGPLQAIVADTIRAAQGDMAPHLAMLDTAYGMIEARMAGRTWVAGEAFSLADCAAAPALFYARTLRPFPAGFAGLAAYYERLMERPSMHRVLEEATPYFSMYPFAQSLPEKYRPA